MSGQNIEMNLVFLKISSNAKYVNVYTRTKDFDCTESVGWVFDVFVYLIEKIGH